MGDEFSMERAIFKQWYAEEIGPISDEEMENINFAFMDIAKMFPSFFLTDEKYKEMEQAGLKGAAAGKKLAVDFADGTISMDIVRGDHD